MLIRSLAAMLVTVVAGAGVAAGQGASRDITVEAMRGERRVALVIGNGSYPSSPLKNPVNDARDMARTLKALGFDVMAHENLNQRDMKLVVTEFGRRLRGSDVGLFFFAGHGMQVGGRNFLVPVDAAPNSEDEVDADSIDVAAVLSRMAGARNRLNVVILDACRDNPFGRSFRSQTRGLAFVDAPTGTLIAYATSPGKVARDGDGRNGVYTGELVRVLPTPGLKLEEVFKHVREAVQRATNHDQVPWEASSVVGEFMFALPTRPTEEPAARVAVAPPPAVPDPPRFQVQKEIRQALGTLALSAAVPGVDVWLAGQKIGTTEAGASLVVWNVPAGKHRLTARKDGHRPWEREVEVLANQRSDVVIDITSLAPASVIKGDDGADMVLVPAGEFWMGNTAAEVERLKKEDCKAPGPSVEQCEREAPRHRVHLDAYYIDRYEITNALFERFVRATNHRTSAEQEGDAGVSLQKDGQWEWAKVPGATWRSPSGPGTKAPPDHPVVNVSWEDAQAYCRWAGKRLPTEAEWEKAARGTDGRRYPWGEIWESSRANGAITVKTTSPVGSYPTGVSPFGAHDMSGNVWEWVSDWFAKEYYASSPERNPTGPPSGSLHPVRGGSWVPNPTFLRSTFRLVYSPTNRYSDLGFRCAKGLGP